MKNVKIISIVFVMLFFCFLHEVKTQATFEGNNNTAPPNSFIGWDNTVNDPLEVRHDAFQPILFSTDGDERMRVAEFGNVSIGGSNAPDPKLEVVLGNSNAAPAPNFESTAIFAFNRFQSTDPGGPINRGLRAISIVPNVGPPMIPFNGVNMAGSFWARQALLNVGIEANVSWFEDFAEEGPDFAGQAGVGIQAAARDHRQENVAVRGRARAHSNEPGAWTVAIHGAVEQLISTNSWSGWFDGDIMYNGQMLNPSDENLKENIEPLEGAMDIINQLEPKTFNYLSESFESMSLPQGLQYGVIAQEMAEVLPELTRDATKAPLLDSLGNEVAPSVSFQPILFSVSSLRSLRLPCVHCG